MEVAADRDLRLVHERMKARLLGRVRHRLEQHSAGIDDRGMVVGERGRDDDVDLIERDRQSIVGAPRHRDADDIAQGQDGELVRLVHELRRPESITRVYRLRCDLDQARPLETLQGLADRSARDAERFRQLVVAKMLPRQEPAFEDRLADGAVHLVAEHGAACVDGNERNSGHECGHCTYPCWERSRE